MDKPGLRDALPQPRQSDTRNDPFWSSLDSSLSATTPQPSEPVAKRDLDVGLGDVARGVGAGALDLVGGIGELARQASNFGKENAGKQVGDYLEQARANMANKLSPLLDVVAGAGDLAASGAESLNDGMSADAKKALGRRLVDETPEGRLTLGDGAGDIDVWAMKMAQGVGSLLPTLAAGGVTGVAAKASIGRAVTASMVKRGATQEVAEAVAAKAVSKIATGAAVTTGATGSVGSAGVNTRDTVLGMSFDELAASDTFRQAFTRIDQDQQTEHLSDEEKLALAREETANLASRATMSDAKVWGAAAMGSMMGDAMLFKMLAGKAATGGVLKGAAKGAVGEGVGETLEEGIQQYAVNESLNDVAAADIDPMKGVMSSAIEGGLIGMGTGGAVGAVGGARGGKHASQEDGVGTDPVAEPSAPVTEGAAGPAVDPNFASVPLEDGEQAPSASQAEGDLNPLGPSASQFPGVFERDQRGILRVKGDVDALASWAEQADMPYITDGDGIAIPAKYAKQAEKAIKGYRPVAAEPMAEAAPADMLAFSQVDPIEHEPAIKRQGFVMRNGDGQSTGEPEPYVRPQSGDELLYESSANWQAGQPHAESAPVDLEALRKESAQRWRDGNKPEAGTPVRTEEDTEQALNALRAEGVNGWAGRQDPKLDMPKGQEFIPHGPQAGLPAVVGDGVQQAAGKAKGLPLSDTIFAGGPSHGGQADNTNYARPHLTREQVDTSMGEQSTRDPRSPLAQSIAKAGSATDSVFGPLRTLRITRKGKPFGTEKEAAMASRKGKEIPVPLNGGGFGVAEIAEVEQVRTEQPTPSQPQQLAPAVDTGYRDVIPSSEQSEVTHGQPTPIPAISSERPGDQPGAGDPVATGVGQTPAELAERAGPGDPADGAPLTPVPVTQPGEENALTAPAPAGVAVSEEVQPEQARTTAGPAAAPTPWSGMIDNPDGTITLEGEVPIIKQWAKDNGVKAIPGKGGLVVAKSFTAKVRGLTAPAANEPSALVEAARGGVVPEPTEVDLIDRDLLKEHAGRWKYRSAVGAGWFTSNTKEGAIDRAREAYRRAFEKGDPLPTREERWEQSEREFAGRMDNRFGGMTINELEKRHQNLGGTIADLQLAGRHEMNGNGGRRTGAAVANEGARQAGQEKMDLERYIQLRREREEMAGSAPARMIEAARSEVAPEPTEAQKEAGNYKKGHLTLQGLDIALENPKGSTRSGIDPDGKEWQSTMAHDYGYIKRTLGADGDHVDVFIGDKPDSETVYVVDQVDPKTGKFDEHKVMMGFADEQAALEGYLGNYEEGWQGLGAIKAMTVVDFKRWVKEGDTTKAVSDLPASEPTIKQWVDSAPDDLLGGMSRLFKGDMSYGEFRDFAERTIISGEGIKAMFGGWTVPRLKEYLTANNAYVFSGTKKAELVERATRIMQGEVRWPSAGGAGVLTTTNNPFAKSNASPADALRAEVQGITEARYGEFVARRKELNAAHEARKQAIAKAIENPQTLDDYRTLARMKGREGMTAEQVGEYERLLTEAQLDKQDADKAAEQAAKLTATPSGDIIKTKHTKHGYDLFVVQMANRVEKDEYTRINAKAKETGGWYSSFKGSGAVPGFQFKEEAQATDFRAWLTGQGQAESKPSVTAEAPTVNMEEPASSPDDNVAKQIAGLRQRAETIRTKANAALAVDRKANTLRRAGMAARATAAAEEELKTADLLDAIADGVTTGKANILRNLTTKAQLATLRSRLARAMYDLPNAEYERLKGEGLIRMGSQGRHEWTDKAGPLVRVEGAKMPGLDYWTRQLDDLASEMQASSNRSHKAAGVKLKNLAKAAEANQLRQVAVTDRDLIDKLTAFVRGSQEGTQAFRVAEQLTDADRLNKMGIFSRANLRAALVELQAIEAGLGKRAEVSPLRTKEQALKLKLLGNRNAFIDFFPTTEDDAADLAGRLGIEPGMTVLEPSAGHGMLADAARDAGAKVDAVEIAGDLRDILTEKGHTLIGNDFMALTQTASYDAVIMNPPFSNGMDMDHVRHAYDFLKPGGRLAAIVSAGAGQQSTRKGQEFAAWLDALGAEVELMREGAFKDSLNPTSVRTKIIVLEKPVGETAPSPSPEGKRVTVSTPKGNAVEVQYRVVEAADLVTSHDFEGNINHNYPQQLQPRDRSKQTYRVQVGQLAAAPDGARLAASPETDRGAPIVSGLVVESGNGRSIGLRQAYQRGDADAYRRYIEANAADFGIDPAVIGAMKQPVLVRERITTMTDDQQRDFVVDSNTDAKMANSAAEDAGADAGKLTDDMLDLLNIPEGGDVLASQNNRFLQAFLSAIGENQSNSYVSRDGQWNDAYRKRVTAAIFAYGYDNQRLLDAATGEVDADGRNITTALINNAVGMAKLRQHSPERAKVISNYLAEAVESIARAKRSGQSLQEMAAQSDMLGGDTSPEGSLLAQAIAASARSAKAITGMVGDILTMLNKTTSADMFGAAVDPATPETAINETLKAISAYNQQKASQPKPGGDLFGLAGARNNHGAAPSVPRSGDASAAKGAGGVTEGRLELDGVSIRIPAIDEEQQRLYNQATHRGQGVNFASGISTGVGRILNDLKDAGLLDTAEQRAAAEAEVQAWANEEAINARKLMRDGIKNPSWAITGRSGRKAQSSAAQDAENRRQAAHHKDQSDRITALRGELKKLRQKEVIGKESFNYAWGKAKGMIADYASAQSNGQPNLLASLRKSMNAELARYLQSMGKIDAPNFIKTLKEQDQRLKAAGHDGLVAIVGARSNPGKIISNAIDGRIRFSKQAMSQGMRPAKHLTRKEAELVTKGWFKQYRGASGIDVQIHATQAELEESLGLDAKEGLIRRAAFDDDAGTLHVAADTISDPKRMREILRHEVLAHYGLANVLGDGEYTKLMSRLIGSQKDPSMKPVWDWVNTHYADEDIGTKAEEVVAHLAELEQGAWGRGWDRVVAWVTRALRAVGFVPDGITAAETRSLIEGLGKKLQRSGPDDSGPDGGKKFSQEAERPAQKGGIKMSQASTAADAAMEKLNLGPKPDIIDKTKASLNKLRQVDRGVVSSWIDRVIKKANTEVLDALAPIKYAEEAAGITDAADSGYVAARMATGAASTMQATMLYGLPEWNDGVIQRKAGTGEKDALLGIFADLGADLHNWLGWMAGHRAELLMAQGRENLLDANDIAALKGQGKGKEAKFLDAKARWNRLNAATLDLAQEAGLFTKEARAEFESEWYIPFFRESDDGDVIAPFKTKGIANQNAGIKKLKGGEANTNDLLENIFTSTSKLIDASMKNMAAQKTVWNLADTGIIEVIPKPNKMDYQALANGKDRIMVKLEGEDYMIRVEDPDLYRAMTFFDRKPFSAMVNVAAKAKRLLTAGVTASPEFMLRNFLRDSLSSWAISKDGFRPVIDSIKGVKKTLAMDGSTIDVMFSGASFLGGYVNGNDPEAMADTVRKSLRRKGMTPEQIARYEKSIIRNAAQAKGVVANVWEKYNRYGEAFENANREAVYAAAIKAGKSHAQAAFESKDLMDFSMLGASRTMQVMTQLLPFFNARVQGLGKLTRELRDNPRAIAKRAGMITAASLALLAANWDDERYEELPDWDKDANWHFFVGDQHFRIPKPFEIGVLFGTIPERMVRALGDKDSGAQFGKAVARAIGDTFALNPIPQIAKPVVETTVNYDFFKGGPIDGPQDLNVQAEARYNEQTSLLMRELGELTGFSPKQLEHLVIGYTGTMGSYVMAAADGLIRASRPGESASWRADEIPLVKAVYRGSGPAKSTQHMEEFYRMLNEVNQLKRTVDQYRSEGLTDKANELLEEQGGILKSRRSLSRTQQQVRVVRNKIELIQRDRTLTAEEKRRRIDEMLARRNDLVYQAVNKNKANWE
ncbi:hypothetical protein N5D99_06975 [Aeromonas caviae]|uniref:LPD38 domain-containing protein n=1 Tax=Aeromonas caviae TaxID=648 RepID=UPI002447F054|nr:LPD38 domain-containing protein [Aeromonas caviae]MDH1844639.1 hypothetical protein [Aeromonas caviae]